MVVSEAGYESCFLILCFMGFREPFSEIEIYTRYAWLKPDVIWNVPILVNYDLAMELVLSTMYYFAATQKPLGISEESRVKPYRLFQPD